MNCKASGCDRAARTLSYCQKHYQRLWRTGSLNTPNAWGSVVDRLWAKVDRRGPSECWLWTAGVSKAGYGRLGDGKGGAILAHRIAWETANGALPRGRGHSMVVMHSCDTPRCCNPAHLRLGTQADNVADMVAKNRQKRGNQYSAAA